MHAFWDTKQSVMSKVHRALLVLKAASMSGLAISNLYSDRVYSRVQRSSGRHSSTGDHLVSECLWEMCGGERVVLALGLGSGSIDNRCHTDNRPTVL